MRMTYIIGIDGGGSKTEFAVSDHNMKIVERFRIEKDSNPWHCGIEQTVAVLREGLQRLHSYQAETDALVAGIAGCFNPNHFREPIMATLREFNKNAALVGDLPTGFRAVTNEAAGIIAIAGSGSSAVLFYGNGEHYLYDAVGNGGRDIGFMVSQAYTRGHLGAAARDFVAKSIPDLPAGSLATTAELYHSATVRDLPRQIAKLPTDDPAFQDIQPWIDSAADRWRFKLYGMITKFAGIRNDLDHFPVVLNGGLWKFDYFREQVVAPLEKEFPQITILFDPEAEPIIGALRLAKDVASA